MVYQYGFELEGQISPAMCLTIGISFQIYIILDGLDGKQARKTGNSTALGMLFDHGCDCIVAVINSALLQRLFSTGSNLDSIMNPIIGTFPFYFITME